MTRKPVCPIALLAAALVFAARPAGAADASSTVPGVGGGNNLTYGGAGILILDIDHGHTFVKRVPMPTSLPPSSNGRPVSPRHRDDPGRV